MWKLKENITLKDLRSFGYSKLDHLKFNMNFDNGFYLFMQYCSSRYNHFAVKKISETIYIVIEENLTIEQYKGKQSGNREYFNYGILPVELNVKHIKDLIKAKVVEEIKE